MWPLRSIFFFVFFWSACFASLANPLIGVLNYVLLYHINPTTAWWGRPLTDMGTRYSLLAALFTAGGLFLGRKKVPFCRPFFTWWELGFIALVVVGALNLVLGVMCDVRTLAVFEKLWKLAAFVLIFCRMASTRSNLRSVLWAFVVGCLYLGHDAYTAPRGAFILGRLDGIGGPDISTSSGLAAHLVACLPLIGTAFLTSQSWKGRVVALAAAGFSVNAVAMCRTRSAFIGLAAGALAALLIAPRAKRFRIHALIILGGLVSYGLTDNYFWERMATLTSAKALETDRAAMIRKEIWTTSLDIFQDHPFGVGPGNFSSIIGVYDERHLKRDTHNSLVQCFVELGVQGGCIFLLLIAGSAWLAFRSSQLAHRTPYYLETKIMAYGLFVSVVTYFVTALGTQRLYTESFWWIMALPLCLHRSVMREIEARRDIMEPAPQSAFAVEQGASIPGDGAFHPAM